MDTKGQKQREKKHSQRASGLTSEEEKNDQAGKNMEEGSSENMKEIVLSRVSGEYKGYLDSCKTSSKKEPNSKKLNSAKSNTSKKSREILPSKKVL